MHVVFDQILDVKETPIESNKQSLDDEKHPKMDEECMKEALQGVSKNLKSPRGLSLKKCHWRCF